jgi:monothiol glutaredoxin
MSNDLVFSKIRDTLEHNNVVLYMKGTKFAPACGFSSAVVRILNSFDIDFFDINVLVDEEIRQGIKDYNNWPTVPQLFVKSEFVGGCDIVVESFKDGSLKDLFVNKGIIS